MSQYKVLADQLYSAEGVVADVVRIAAANILLVLCAHIVVPLPFTPVPITGQTFGVLLVAVLLGARRSGIALVLYLLEGLAGLPVFGPFFVQSDTSTDRMPSTRPSPRSSRLRLQNCCCEMDVSAHCESMKMVCPRCKGTSVSR